MGTSAGSKPGHSPSNISRLTTPCSWETPLARPGQAQTHDGHVEHARRSAGIGLGAEGEQPLDRHALEGLGAAEVPLDDRGVEAVDPGRDRGVRREDRRGSGRRSSASSKVIPSLGDELVDPLDAEEAGVALVGVVDVRRRRAGQPRPQPQRADAADAEQELLLEALLAAAAVEPLGDDPGGVVVAGDVGVEEQQRHPADLGLPHVGPQVTAARQRRGVMTHGLAVLVAQQGQRKAVRVEDRVGLLLPPLAVEALLEVAGLVEETDADDRHAEVGGGLEVVAGEDPEAARVLRQRRGDAELGAEVGDRRGCPGAVLARGPLLVPAVLVEVPVEGRLGIVDPGGEPVVLGQPRQLGRSTSPTAWRRGRGGPGATAAGSMLSKRSPIGGCQLQRRLWRARPGRRCARAGRGGR